MLEFENTNTLQSSNFKYLKELSNFKRVNFQILKLTHFQIVCGQGWIRTTELRRGQIYSLLPLATWLLAQIMRRNGTSYAIEPKKGVEPPTY